MRLKELLSGVHVLEQSADAAALNMEITGIEYDSRNIAAGNAFIAFRGETTDGNRYLDSAIARGARAVVSDSARPAGLSLPWLRVSHGRQALARISANFYGAPAGKLKIVGVTGTNGKTTTSFLLSRLLSEAGHGEAVLIGTIEYRFAGRVVPAPHTTPEALELNRIFAQAVDEKLGKSVASHAVMEVSSHALAQDRVFGFHFDTAIFTNLTRDHLDYHGSMEEYFVAKKKLFAGCGAPAPRVAILNSDDEYGRRLADISRVAGSEVYTYGLHSGNFRASLQVSQLDRQGTRFQMHSPFGDAILSSRMVGEMNIYNLVAAAAGALVLGTPLERVSQAMARTGTVPGRFEQVSCGQPFSVVVDYAHTDDALRNLTAVARQFVAASATREGRRGRVITLFGCGGDRDKTKRPLMGKAAGDGSDFVVLTSDNPRNEDPLAIIHDALPGLKQSGTPFTVEPDRQKAIAQAIAEAAPGDIVLIAGKGHEKLQVTRSGAAPFDDVQVARQALQSCGFMAAAPGGSAV